MPARRPGQRAGELRAARSAACTTLPTLSAETRFPLGLFRAWAVWRPAAQLLVYPRPNARPRRCRRRAPCPAAPARRAQADGGEVEGVRGYRRGDPLKLVVWKKAAQGARQPAANWSAATPRVGAAAAVARLAGLRRARPRGAPVAPDRLGAGGAARRRRLRPAPARARASRPAEGEAHRRAAWRRWRCGAEPADAARRLAAAALAGLVAPAARERATRCSCSAVIAWTVLPHLSHLPAWCIALTAVVLLWRAALALGNAPAAAAAGCWWCVLAVAAGLTFWSLPHPARQGAGRDAWRWC